MVEQTMAESATADDPTVRTLSFDDMYVLHTGGVDVFVYDMHEDPLPPPYYIDVGDRRFAFTGLTYLEKGHGAVLPTWVSEEEAAGRLAMFVLRNERLLAYLHDLAATEDDEGAAEEA